jgi:hypothetical protein
MPTPTLSPAIINAAIVGFEQQKLRIDAQIAGLRAMLDGGRSEPATTLAVPKGKRRKISAAARKRMSEGQRKRWAESKGEAESPSALEMSKSKRRLSAAGRKAISEATKKRWAAQKAAAAKKAPVKTAAKTAAARKPQMKATKSTQQVAQ